MNIVQLDRRAIPGGSRGAAGAPACSTTPSLGEGPGLRSIVACDQGDQMTSQRQLIGQGSAA